MPALVAGALLGDYVQTVLYESVRVIAVAFIVGGMVMLVVERFRPAPAVLDAERTPLARAFGVGVCQMLALVPGVSRSGATIVGGMLMRLDRPAAAEFSFFLAMPTMVAAFGYELMQVRASLAPDRAAEIAIGFVMAFIASAVVVKPFLSFVQALGVCAVRVVPHRRRGRAAGAVSGGVGTDAVAAAQVHRRVLRHRPAGDQRCRAGVDLRYH